MVPLGSTLLLTNFYVRRISFCHTNIKSRAHNFSRVQSQARNLYFRRQSDRESRSAGANYPNRKIEAKDFEKAYSIFIEIWKNIFFTTLQAESFLKSRKQPKFGDATSFHAK